MLARVGSTCSHVSEDARLPKDPGGNILVTYLSKMWYLWTKNMKGGLCKLKFCTKATQTLPFESLQKNFLHSHPLHGANISQIFSFTRTASSHNIQLVPNIQNTSFHIPVKSSIEPRALVATIQFVPKYKSKVKLISKYFTQKQLFP